MNVALPITLAVIVSIVSPYVLAHQVSKARRREKQEEWARQDEVAARLLAANTATNEKLDVIHTLVNSDMTKALKGQLVALEAQLAMTPNRTVKQKKIRSGLAAEIKDLRLVLVDREKAAKTITAQKRKPRRKR